MEENYIAIGKIAGAVGLDGWLRAVTYSEIPERFQLLSSFYLETDMGLQGFVLESVDMAPKGAMLKLKGVDTRVDAERLTGKEILVEFEERLDLPEDTYYIHDLIGCRVVVDETDENLGEITEVMTGAGNDVYVVHNERNQEILIPVVSRFVKHIDIDNKQVRVELIDGMRPEDED